MLNEKEKILYKNTDIDTFQMMLFRFYSDFSQNENFLKFETTPLNKGRYDICSRELFNDPQYYYIFPLMSGDYLWEENFGNSYYIPTENDIISFRNEIKENHQNFLP